MTETEKVTILTAISTDDVVRIARNKAQTYLDNLVAELNAQENCNERK